MLTVFGHRDAQLPSDIPTNLLNYYKVHEERQFIALHFQSFLFQVRIIGVA